MMDKVQKHNSFNTNTPSSESYKNYLEIDVFTNKIQRRINRHEKEEVTGGHRELHNEELHNLHSAPNRVVK
jgi:hypothetical protein